MKADWRAWSAAALCSLLLVPAAGALPKLQWNAHVYQRLRAANRDAPDSAIDAANRRLLAFLPPAGPVGFNVASIADLPAAAQQRVEQFLLYSIEPRDLRLSIDYEFVIECGPAAAAASLSHNPAFGLVASVDADLRLFRRVPR